MLRIINIGSVYYLAAGAFAVILWVLLKNKRITKRVALTVLFPYLFLVVVATILSRRVRVDCNLIITPFWTIQRIITGGKEKAWLLKEVILNTFMLVPVGLLAPVLFKKRKMVQTMLFGGGLSVGIELLQLLTHRGYSEIDDVIYNLVGVFIGYRLYRVMKRRQINAQ